MKKNTAVTAVTVATVLGLAFFFIGAWQITLALADPSIKGINWIQLSIGLGVFGFPFFVFERAIKVSLKETPRKQGPEEGPKEKPEEPQRKVPGKTRIYLVAKVTGLPPREVRAKYATFKKILEDHGYEGVAPTDHVNPNSDWHSAMKVCIPLLISCDYYMIIGETHTSAGATIEVTIAEWLQIPRAIMDEPGIEEKADFIFESYTHQEA